MNKIVYITEIAICLLITSNLSAQQLTDKEIGFEKEKVQKELLSSGIDKNDLDFKVAEYRNILEQNYNVRQEIAARRSLPTPIIMSNCINMGFEDNTQGWSLYINTNNYGVPPTNDNLSNSTIGNSDLSSFGSQLGTFDANRIAVVPANHPDSMLSQIGHPVVKSDDPNDMIVRLGIPGQVNAGQEEITKRMALDPLHSVISYGYAVIQNQPNHSHEYQPFFKIRIAISGPNTLPPCASITYYADQASGNGFHLVGTTGYWAKPWQTNTIDLAQYVDFNINPNPVVTVTFSNADCAYGGHDAWAYVDASCEPANSSIHASSTNACLGQSITFSTEGIEIFDLASVSWKIYHIDNPVPLHTATGTQTTSFVFPHAGLFRIEYTVQNGSECDFKYGTIVRVRKCTGVQECDTCASFSPQPGEKYIISGWIKEKKTNGSEIKVKGYTKPHIRILTSDHNDQQLANELFYASGEIIDGWQRIHGEFTIGEQAKDLFLYLENGDGNNIAYFDDIRVFPYNGSMKSFVYDFATQKLMAELDENNYATFYEYDSEGGLIRVKKETSDGIRTIQETRSGNAKRKNTHD